MSGSKQQHIGTYATEREAHEAYLRAVALLNSGWTGSLQELRAIVKEPCTSPDIDD